MGDIDLTPEEEIIVKILKESGCVGIETSMKPDALLTKAAAEGISDSRKVEQATVSLIDKDVVEYEMDENLETSDVWLLNELNT